jgi:hypothetical protein
MVNLAESDWLVVGTALIHVTHSPPAAPLPASDGLSRKDVSQKFRLMKLPTSTIVPSLSLKPPRSPQNAKEDLSMAITEIFTSLWTLSAYLAAPKWAQKHFRARMWSHSALSNCQPRSRISCSRSPVKDGNSRTCRVPDAFHHTFLVHAPQPLHLANKYLVFSHTSLRFRSIFDGLWVSRPVRCRKCFSV